LGGRVGGASSGARALRQLLTTGVTVSASLDRFHDDEPACKNALVAYDDKLAAQVRALLEGERELEEKRMFGGLGLLIRGNMAVAVRGKGGLLVRVDPERSGEVLSEPGAKLMKMRGKTMKGWVTVDPSACTKLADVRRWVKRGVTYAKSLPPKT
jgi:TfoX/Sxy family transcriptional regulator of competence genes